MRHKIESLYAGTILMALGIVLLVINSVHPGTHLVRDGSGFIVVGLLINLICVLVDHKIKKLS